MKKKILILGGASVHCKLVEVAQKLGCYTIVTDYLNNSPAKQIADESWNLNIMDVDLIVEKCKEEKVDAVISGWLDPCQRPYCEICEKLGLPCYGTKEQFYQMTDKHAFKKMCIDNGVDVIPEYDERDIDKVEYPVFVKPVDNRGSRGQTVCYDKESLVKAIEYAKSESSNGDILIEKYMKDAEELQVTYFFVNGEPFLLRTTDSYCGSEDNHLEKVVACAISPSKHTEQYLKTSHNQVIKMFKRLGFMNGPIFMQGFVDKGVFRFFDPGLRFPGVDYERIYEKVFGISLMELMVQIAVNGKCDQGVVLPKDGVNLNGKRAAVLFPTVKAGKVGKICGLEELISDDHVVSVWRRCDVGDEVKWCYNVNQRSLEADILCDGTEQLKKYLKKFLSKYKVYDINGNDMVFEIFDAERVI